MSKQLTIKVVSPHLETAVSDYLCDEAFSESDNGVGYGGYFVLTGPESYDHQDYKPTDGEVYDLEKGSWSEMEKKVEAFQKSAEDMSVDLPEGYYHIRPNGDIEADCGTIVEAKSVKKLVTAYAKIIAPDWLTVKAAAKKKSAVKKKK